MAPLPTGFPAADAADDFLRARRRQTLSRLAQRLGRQGEVDLILPFDEVVAALGRTGERDLGLQGRRRSTRSSARSTAGRASTAASAPPPRACAAAGSGSQTRRAAASRCRRSTSTGSASSTSCATATTASPWPARWGASEIDAHVVEILTRVGAERTLTVADLPLKSHERLFRERVPLPPEAAERVRLGPCARYGELAEGVEAWGLSLRCRRRGELLDREQLGTPLVRARSTARSSRCCARPT